MEIEVDIWTFWKRQIILNFHWGRFTKNCKRVVGKLREKDLSALRSQRSRLHQHRDGWTKPALIISSTARNSKRQQRSFSLLAHHDIAFFDTAYQVRLGGTIHSLGHSFRLFADQSCLHITIYSWRYSEKALACCCRWGKLEAFVVCGGGCADVADPFRKENVWCYYCGCGYNL